MSLKFMWLITISLVLGKLSLAKVKHAELPENVNSALCHIIKITELETNFNTLIILDTTGKEINWKCTTKPRIVLSKKVNVELKKLFNIEMLFVVQLTQMTELDYLSELLNNMRSTRVIIKLEADEQNKTQLQLQFRSIFRYCWSKYMLNVIIILNEFEYTQNYYSYKPFPALKTEQHNLKLSNASIFPKRMQNLHGYPLRTYPDQLHPRTLLYRNSNGKLKMIGYIGRLLETFAQKLNANLIYGFPVRLGTSYFYTEILKLTRNGTLDIPASIVCLNEHAMDLQDFSHFIEIGAWFPMVPVAAAQAQSEVYALLFRTKLAAIFLGLYLCFAATQFLSSLLMTSHPKRDIYMQLLLSENSILGIIGSTFQRRRCHSSNSKLIFILLCFTGLFFNTIFNTFLSSFITYPPSEPELNSFDDMLQHNVTIAESANAALLLPLYAGSHFVAKYRSLFNVMKNLTAFVEHRRSLQPGMAYGITSSLWEVHQKRQRYFSRKLYRKSPHLTFSNFMLYALPLPANSIFQEPLNVYIFQLHATGIFEHWYRSSFHDMIQVGLMSFQDLSTPRSFNAAIVDYYYWIWLFYIAGVLASLLIFVGECILAKFIKLSESTFEFVL